MDKLQDVFKRDYILFVKIFNLTGMDRLGDPLKVTACDGSAGEGVIGDIGTKNALIVHKEKLAPQINLFEIRAPAVAKNAKPGQFVVIRLHERGERIPLTIADVDPIRGTITIVAQEVGKTTHELGLYEVGQRILDILGPLGNPSHIDHFGTVVMVGGGVGVAEIYPVAKAMKEKGNKVISILGFRSKDLVFWEEKLRKVSDEVIVTTNDGSYGMKGFTTDALRKLIEDGRKLDLVHAVGPMIMMKLIAELTKPHGIKTVVSLNPIMLDGTGMCGVCRVSISGKIRFACVDGPEFDAHQVDFDELLRRLDYYKDLEAISFEKWKRERGMI